MAIIIFIIYYFLLYYHICDESIKQFDQNRKIHEITQQN